MMSWLAAWIPGGAEGVPIPYSPRMDDGITIVLLCCFFLSAYVLSRSRRFLLQLVKDFLLHRERTSIFATSTAGDMRYLLLLILQTCILSGVCIQHSFTAIYYRKLPFCLRNIPGQNEQLLFSNLLKIIYLCNKVIIDIAER